MYRINRVSQSIRSHVKNTLTSPHDNLLTSAVTVLSSLYEGWLCFRVSVTHGFSKAPFFHAALRTVNYCSTITVTPTN